MENATNAKASENVVGEVAKVRSLRAYAVSGSLVADSMSSTFNSSIAPGKLPNPSVPQFPHLHQRDAAIADEVDNT